MTGVVLPLAVETIFCEEGLRGDNGGEYQSPHMKKNSLWWGLFIKKKKINESIYFCQNLYLPIYPKI